MRIFGVYFMDNRPIGIFDSGLGGLTAAKRLEEILPGEDIIYFGDSARMPYGGYDLPTLTRYAEQNARFLADKNVKAIVVACGTVTSNCLEEVAAKFDIPFFGVMQACCSRAVRETRNGKIGVIATQATVNSGKYAALLKSLRSDVEVISKACPSLAPLVESGHFRRGDEMAHKAIEEELEIIKASGADTLLLACTHYPLLSEVIEDYLGKDVVQISSGAEAVNELRDHLAGIDALADRQTGTREYYTSGDTAAFSLRAEVFLSHPITAQLHEMK